MDTTYSDAGSVQQTGRTNVHTNIGQHNKEQTLHTMGTKKAAEIGFNII